MEERGRTDEVVIFVGSGRPERGPLPISDTADRDAKSSCQTLEDNETTLVLEVRGSACLESSCRNSPVSGKKTRVRQELARALLSRPALTTVRLRVQGGGPGLRRLGRRPRLGLRSRGLLSPVDLVRSSLLACPRQALCPFPSRPAAAAFPPAIGPQVCSSLSSRAFLASRCYLRRCGAAARRCDATPSNASDNSGQITSI
jgi:hypothetical protein